MAALFPTIARRNPLETLGRLSRSPAAIPILAAASIAALLALAWSRRFIQDDAFISFRYARNLVDHRGLVFNPGERVEGYTNFLWTLLMAAGIRLGVPVVPWSHLLGLAAFAGSLVLLFLLARHILGSRGWSFVALLVVGTNYSFSAYATGGLETSLQAFTVLLALQFAYRAREALRPLHLMAFSLAAAAALLTRLDSALLLAIPAADLLAGVSRSSAEPRGGRGGDRGSRLLALTLPGLVPLAAWFAWKAFYYGDLLPLTFYAKQGGAVGPTVEQGLRFLFEYLRSYWMFPQLALLLFFARPLWREWTTRWLVAGCALWWLYVLWFGGDFMEFRLMTPVLPCWTICVLWVLARRIADSRVKNALTGVLVALALAGSWHHQATFTSDAGIESVADLRGHLTVQAWDRVGEVLGTSFRGHEDEVTIAVTAAGVIPFYSGLRAVDMIGLNDAWIARQGLRLKTQPGHERTAPFDYLLSRGVNLVIAHPIVVPLDYRFDFSRGVDLSLFRIFDARPERLPAGARLVEIPIGGGLKILALYLVPNRQVDAAIEKYRWWSAQLVSR